MKVPAGRADAFAAAPPAGIRAVLVYGPDEGLARERAERLVRSVVDDPADPFRVVGLDAAEVASDPARLADEAAAIAFGGGRRVVRLRGAGDKLVPACETLLSSPAAEALTVIEAGPLPPRSKLRALFEKAEAGAALACYADEGQALDALIDAAMKEHGLRLAPDARAYLAANLGADRMVSRQELGKLALYAGPDRDGPVTLEEAKACVGDAAAQTLDDAVYAAAEGDHAVLDRALGRLSREGTHAVAILRAAARHFQRLHAVKGAVAAGKPVTDAVKALRPPVFFKLEGRFAAQVRGWSEPGLADALGRLLDTEARCKRTGAATDALCGRCLLSIANAGQRAMRRR